MNNKANILDDIIRQQLASDKAFNTKRMLVNNSLFNLPGVTPIEFNPQKSYMVGSVTYVIEKMDFLGALWNAHKPMDEMKIFLIDDIDDNPLSCYVRPERLITAVDIANESLKINAVWVHLHEQADKSVIITFIWNHFIENVGIVQYGARLLKKYTNVDDVPEFLCPGTSKKINEYEAITYFPKNFNLLEQELYNEHE